MNLLGWLCQLWMLKADMMSRPNSRLGSSPRLYILQTAVLLLEKMQS